MKVIQTALLVIALIGSSIVATSADARGRGGHGHGHRHHHGHGHSHFGFFFSVPPPFFYYPSYYYPRYYYPPAVGPASPTVYIEQPPAAAAPAGASTESAGAFWHYCRDSQTYYPYVQQCASPWERVVPNSTPPS